MSIRAGHIGRRIQIQEPIAEWGTVRGVSGGKDANGKDRVGSRPVERKLRLDDLGVRVSLHAMADGGSCTAHPCLAANK